MADDAKKLIDFNDFIGGEEALAAAARNLRKLKTDSSDLAKTVADDSGRIKAGFATIGEALQSLQGKVGKLNLITDADKKLLTDYIKQVGDLKAQKALLAETERAQRLLQDGLTDSTKQYTSELAKQKAALREAAAAGDIEGQKKAAQAVRQLATETKDLSAALRGSNSALTAAKGSYDALVIENNKLTATLKGLGGGLANTSDEAVRLQLQINKNNDTLKAFDQQLGLNYRNVGNYAQSFEGLIKELARARVAQEGYAAGSERAAAGQLRISGFQTAAQKAAAQAGLTYQQAEAKIEQYTAAVQPLTQALVRLEEKQFNLGRTTGVETEAYRKLGFQIEGTKKQIDEVAAATVKAEDKQSGLAQQLGFTKEGFKQYAGQLLVGVAGLQALASAGQAFFDSNVQYSRDLAEVRKTTGLTADEAERLAESLKNLDTPTSLQGLLKIASVGGQLGIAKGDLLDFTKAIDTAVQALGNDFTGGAEEIATVLGKISSVFRKELGPDAAKNILAIGSAVNQIGADGAATAPFLTDVALRVGAISSSTGVGLKNVLAYAAVLQETGSTSEVAGTALNRFFTTLTTRTKAAYEIAKLANPALTLKEFNHLVNTDFNQAIQVFLAGLREGGKSTTDQARLLATLKLQSGEAKNAIITLAQNTDLFAERQKTANDQLRDATSLAAEAAINTETLGGSVDKLTNDTKNFFTSGAAGSLLKWLVDFTRTLYSSTIGSTLRALGDGIQYVREKAGLVDKPLTDYTASMVENALGAQKQAAAQRELLKSYTDLQGATNRSASQELELSQTRAKLIKQFGTDEVAAIEARIAANQQAFDKNKQQLADEVSTLGSLIGKSQAEVAAAQNAANEQDKKLTVEQIARAKQVAQARLTVPLEGKSSVPELESAIAANLRLAKGESVLGEQQRQRALAVAALAKLEGQNTQAKQDGTNASEEAQKHEEKLGRTERENARDRVAILKDQLDDNKKAIQAAKDYQAEQGKLFSSQQITYEVLKENIAGSEDFIAQKQRDGLSIRKLLIRAETASQVEEAKKSRDSQLREKGITENEITDIQGEYSRKRREIDRVEKRAIIQAEKALQKELTDVPPLEIKQPKIDFNQLTADLIPRVKTYQDKVNEILHAGDAEETLLADRLARGEITQRQYDKRSLANKKSHTDEILALDKSFHQTTIDDQIAANKDILDRQKESDKLSLEQRKAAIERTKAIIDEVGGYTQEVETAFFAIRSNQIDAQIAAVQKQYDLESKAAGDNAELKAKLDKDYQKKLDKLNYDKAKSERDAAVISVAISTAVAVAKAFAEYVFPFALIPAGIALAQGALQEAVILSKPLPQYFKGRQDGPAEFAHIAERGPELVQRKQTGRYEYIAEQTILPLGQGDKVFTAAETSRMLAAVNLGPSQAQQPQQLAAAFSGAASEARAQREEAHGRPTAQLAGMIAANTEALRRIKPVVVNVGPGSDASVETSNSLLEYYRQRTRR